MGFPQFPLPYDVIHLAQLVNTGHMYQLWRYGVLYAIRLNSVALLKYCIDYSHSDNSRQLTERCKEKNKKKYIAPYLCLVWAVREKNKTMVEYILKNYSLSRMDIEYALPDSDPNNQNIRELLENTLNNLV
ncbi:MAG: hypothetical protein H0U27_07235 [Nitrosopumilus sp.]|nr:hypothetical protein [Nitrosopumilus sp.]